MVSLILGLLLLTAPCALADPASKSQVDPEARQNYLALSQGVQAARLQQTVAALSQIHYALPAAPGAPPALAYTRLAGTPGADQARDYVKAQFQQIFGTVQEEKFNVTVPIDNGASLSVGGRGYTLRPLWPNLVRTSTLPATGLDGPLIYAGQGGLRAYRGKQVEGSIVLLDFNCGTQWLNAPRLGAKAVIFVEPTQTMRGESESKFIGIPVAIPRFWISRADASALQSAALTTPNFTVHLSCDNPWQTRAASNLIGEIPGSDPALSKQTIVIESYYDSMSVVPTLAPGADTTCGMAALLELARAFKAHPPKRTVVFVASGAHFLGIQGARTYIDRHLDSWQQVSGWDKFRHWVGHSPLPQGRQQVMLFSGLDLTSQTGTVGSFYKGYFYDFREDIAPNYGDIGRYFNQNATKIGQVLGFDPAAAFADGINGVGGKTWRNFLPGHFAFDAEAAALAGGKGVTFATTDDARQRADTPSDTSDTVNIANLLRQTRLLACEYWNVLNDANDPDLVPPDSPKGILPIRDWPAWTRQGLLLGYCRLSGRALRFDPVSNFVPDQPISQSLAVISNPAKTMVGVRGNLIQAVSDVDKNGRPDASFTFVGLPLVTSQNQGLHNPDGLHMAAYHIHATDDALGSRGDIDYAPDQGVNGSAIYPTAFDLNSSFSRKQVIVFPCVATSIYDLIDQAALTSLTGIRILDGATDGEPRQYGYVLSGSEPGVSYVEDVATLFSTPDAQTRLKILMDSGGQTRFLLINPRSWTDEQRKPPSERLCSDDKSCAIGVGYAVGAPSARSANFMSAPDPNNPDDFIRNGAITNTALRVAQDMWHLDDFRIRQLARFRIVDERDTNNPLTKDHLFTRHLIDNALKAYAARDYDAFDAFSRQAWAYEARVYPEAQATASDVVQGVIFYLFLLIPFAYFLERLFFSFADLKRQLGMVFLIFLLIFGVFSQIHPAFHITGNPIIVLIAFIMLALSAIVSLVVWGKFEEQLKSFNRATSGVHKADVGKASIAFAAFTLGISNMRRRKERTLLTCITLILLTFTVLSFTSIQNFTQLNNHPAAGTAPYNGILLRMPTWDPLQEPAYRLLDDAYGGRYAVAPRSWFFGTQQGQQSFLNVTRAQASVALKGVEGFTPQEAQVTHVDSALITGRWFTNADSYSAVLPQEMAATLNISPGDVSKGVYVNFAGTPYRVIGIVDSAKFAAVKDLDNESLTPADFQASQASAANANAASASATKAGFQEYKHLDPKDVLYVPYSTLINIGGDMRSVGINFVSAATVKTELEALIPRLDLNLYGGGNGKNYRFSAIGASSSKGLGSIVIPILISALIVLNTMLGSVFERIKEIAIFSSIGLSPANIAMLFLAEAMVYAIIGAVSGYLIGQGLSFLISTFHILPGLYLNFSSTSAVLSIGIVVGVVLLSTIFPARKASQVASPALSSAWKLPDPIGDVWRITLPFAVTGVQAPGINRYLVEWFRSYSEQSVGDFLTQGFETATVPMEGGEGYRVRGRVWLAPFDLGVSQDVNLDTEPTALAEIYAVTIILTRVSGDVTNWKRVNRRFLNVVRQQFLIWRTLTAAERERYLEVPGTAQDIVSAPLLGGSAAVAPAL